MHTISFIDDDEQTRQLLYRKFKDSFNIYNFTIDERTTISSIIQEFEKQEIHCLIIDYLLDESGDLSFTGDELVEQIHKKRPYFPIIVLTSHEEDALDFFSEVNLVNDKGKYLESESNILKKKIQLIIDNYSKKIEMSEQRLHELIRKDSPSLSIQEEEEIDSIYSFFDSIYPDEKSYPKHLLTRKEISKMTKLLEDTNDILLKLKGSSDA